MPRRGSCGDDPRMKYWQSRAPLAPTVRKLEQKRQNLGHKGFKALNWLYRTKGPVHNKGRIFFSFCIIALGVGKKTPLWPHLLLLSLHPHTLPPPGIEGSHVGGGGGSGQREVCTHTCGAGMCMCVYYEVINYNLNCFLFFCACVCVFKDKDTLSVFSNYVQEYAICSSADLQICKYITEKREMRVQT